MYAAHRGSAGLGFAPLRARPCANVVVHVHVHVHVHALVHCVYLLCFMCMFFVCV